MTTDTRAACSRAFGFEIVELWLDSSSLLWMREIIVVADLIRPDGRKVSYCQTDWRKSVMVQSARNQPRIAQRNCPFGQYREGTGRHVSHCQSYETNGWVFVRHINWKHQSCNNTFLLKLKFCPHNQRSCFTYLKHQTSNADLSKSKRDNIDSCLSFVEYVVKLSNGRPKLQGTRNNLVARSTASVPLQRFPSFKKL